MQKEGQACSQELRREGGGRGGGGGGGTAHSPKISMLTHFHLLLHFDSNFTADITRIICEPWQFCLTGNLS